MTANSTWKNLERKAAKVLNGQRVGSQAYQSTPDVDHDVFAIECKLRAKLAFIPWFEQAKKYAKRLNKIPLLICKQKHSQTEFVILRLADFKELIDTSINH